MEYSEYFHIFGKTIISLSSNYLAMKNRFLLLLSGFCFFFLASCVKEPQPIRVTGITLNATSLSLVEGETSDLVATISPKDADNQTVIWSSSDGSVASVNNRKVTALKAGSTTITAKSDDGGFTASCSVTVVAKIINVSSLSLSIAELTLTEGDSETIIATVKPDNATDKTVTWSTSDESIATVDGGKTTAVKEGTATIIAKAGDKTATCLVTVKHDPMSDAIAFADDNIKAALVKAFDTNGDGELSFGEAASVTSIEGVFGTMKTYTSFDEFQYFTGITSIPQSMFEGWQIISIRIPNNVTSIGAFAFRDCSRLVSVILPTSLSLIGDSMFNGCSSLVEITLPESITGINARAFLGCLSLSSINLPNSITYIGSYAFAGCEALFSLAIPDSVTSIGSFGFYGCKSLNAITIPKDVYKVESSTFRDCSSLVSVTIPQSVTIIESYAFNNCNSLSSIVIPESVNLIGKGAFSECSNLTSIDLPRIRVLDDLTFFRCKSLKTVRIPDSVYSIGSRAFEQCDGLVSIVIPDSVTTIGEAAIRECHSLASITIPKSVTMIGSHALRYCEQLSSITVNALTPPEGGDGMFIGTNNCPIYVTSESVETYKTAKYWSEYADRIQAIGTPEAVDLGLSVKWASFNLGATKPEEYGDYYAWGETEPKGDYSWATYKWCDGSDHTLTKYNDMSTFGTVDNKTVLEPEDDAAHVILGGNWRMPTEEEWYELREKCSWSWSWIKHGMIVTAPNGNSIFLPSPGHKTNQSSYQVGSNGFYWTSTLSTPSGPYAESGQIDDDYFGSFYCNRFRGQSIRPVTE